MRRNELRWASRCGAIGTRLVSTAAGLASSQACGGACAAADRMVGNVRLALVGDAGKERAMAGEPLRRTRHTACIHGCGALGGATAAADWMVGWVRLALFGDAGARVAWNAGGRWKIMCYGG
jgi:hypothetical protein